jgi:hypothetical protein
MNKQPNQAIELKLHIYDEKDPITYTLYVHAESDFYLDLITDLIESCNVFKRLKKNFMYTRRVATEKEMQAIVNKMYKELESEVKSFMYDIVLFKPIPFHFFPSSQ